MKMRKKPQIGALDTELLTGPCLWRERWDRDDIGGDFECCRRCAFIHSYSGSRFRESPRRRIFNGHKQCFVHPFGTDKGNPAFDGRASCNGIATFVAFVAAGLLPLSAYLFPLAEGVRFPAACGLAAASLFATGACRSIFSDRPWLFSGLEMLSLGTIASIVAYGVGATAAALIGESAAKL
jgi:VIT1/CCC1 family predicted Fe2+/Mn2+ transporter